MPTPERLAEQFEQHRPHVRAVAYRMLGSVSEAEDAVQETWIRLSRTDLRLPQVAEAFRHLGFPAYFRVELSWAKLLGVVLLLAPVPARLKEWPYAGFAITLGSALIAHL